MKSYFKGDLSKAVCVAPYAGAWIEISGVNSGTSSIRVAPYAGAWIEILRQL